MHLTKVHLRNWRSYRNVTFQFATPQKSKNVILIGAQNGTGKTSLLMALYLGLFGREAMPLIEGFRFAIAEDQKNFYYRTLLDRVVHRPALQDSDPYAAVWLTFETDAGPVVVKRRWSYNRRGRVRDLNTRDGEEVLIETNGQPQVCTSWQDANAQVEELLFPHSVVPCFFFDGEQAQERVEAAGGKALLDAVNNLYGTGILDILSDSLRTYITNEFNTLRRDVGDIKSDKLDETRLELESTRDELAKVETTLTEKRKQRDVEEANRQRLTGTLYQLVGDSSTDLEQYSGEVRALETEELNARAALTASLGSLSLPLAMRRTSNVTEARLESETIRDRWLLLKEEAMGKAAKIVDEVLPLNAIDGLEPQLSSDQREVLRCRLEHSLEALWSPPPDGCAETFFFPFLSQGDRPTVLTKLRRISSQSVEDVAELASRWNMAVKRLRDVRMRFDNVRDIAPRLEELKKAIQEVTAAIREINNEVVGLELKERGLAAQISELRGAIGQMEKRRAAADPVKQKLDVAYRIRSVVDDAKRSVLPLCQEALEERCTYHFSKMISDEYQKFAVKFEQESEPRLVGPKGEAVFVTSLSGAQKRAFGLAFTLAVADVSGQRAPIVVDTPVGNMDSRYRARVLAHVARNAPGQVIYLSHDEEISAEYERQLRPTIRQTFLIQFEAIAEGSGVSTVTPDSYFDFTG